jgi:hypothetical protein
VKGFSELKYYMQMCDLEKKIILSKENFVVYNYNNEEENRGTPLQKKKVVIINGI